MSYSFKFSATSKIAAREKMLDLEKSNQHIPAAISQLVIDGVSKVAFKEGQIIVVEAAGYGADVFNRTGEAYDVKNEMVVKVF